MLRIVSSLFLERRFRDLCLSLSVTILGHALCVAQDTISPPLVEVSVDDPTIIESLIAESVDDDTKNFPPVPEPWQLETLTAPIVLPQGQRVIAGYDRGFVIASGNDSDLGADEQPYSLRLNGFGQLRHTVFDSEGSTREINQIQLKRARVILSGHAFSTDLDYFVQFDSRSNAADTMRILDYFLTYDLGHGWLDLKQDTIGIKAGLYKIPFSYARWTSGKEFQFSDRSVANMYFDVNRSLGWGVFGNFDTAIAPIRWEAALFNGLVTGGAETGSSGTLDNNSAVSFRLTSDPIGVWGENDLADLEYHEELAMRIGSGFAYSKVDRTGPTEFSEIRVVDSGERLGDLLPQAVDQFAIVLGSFDMSFKYRGWSLTTEYYVRTIDDFQGAAIDRFFDHGLSYEAGWFIVPKTWQLLSRWSRVQGNSASLGSQDESSEEVAGGIVRYFREQHIKLTFDATHLNGAPINSSVLDISPGDDGWLYRTQLQFSF
jgi:hypothetical protein